MGAAGGARLAVALLTASVWLASCGGDQGYTADELISQLDDHGAGLELGESLPSAREGIDVHALRSTAGASGSVTITADADSGLAEYQRCQTAGALVCFRADNAVLIFEELAPDERAGVAAALQVIASG
jgi:hypothetical protein